MSHETSNAKDVPAVSAENTASGFAISGKSDRGVGVGVYGANGAGNLGSNLGVGVWGESSSGFGVFGSSDNFRGVRGLSKAGTGVNGISEAPAAIQPTRNSGVHGEAINGFGVFGSSDTFEGVHGESRSTDTAAVAGVNHTGPGSIGTFGQSDPGRGVVGVSKTNVGVFGFSEASEGVHGESRSTDTAAVAGINHTAPGSIGTFGQSDPGRGVVGISKTNVGVFGFSEASEGVHGESNSANTAAVAGINQSTGAGIYGKSNGGPAGMFQGNVTVTGDVVLVNHQDCAEDFDVAGPEEIEPGTVMVLDPHGALRPSQHAYDKKVAGVVSGAGDYKPGIILDKQLSHNRRIPVALMGKVYCKVDAQHASIDVGDLLTTSPTLGHAMKADDSLKAFGSVIGKALKPLRGGQGLIPILVTLQ